MKKQVSFSRQLTEDQLPGSGRVNGANKKTRPMWGLGERSNSMNQSIFIRESPDLFRHSPASVLNQQRRHQLFVSRSAQNSSMASYSMGDERAPSQIRSASSNERAATPIPMQDFAFSILQHIESEKTRSRNGLNTNMNLTSIDTNELKQSWDSIYHHNVPSRFRFLEATKPSSSQINTNNKNNSSFQIQSYENFRYETQTSSYLPKIKKQSHLKHRKKKPETTIEAKPVAQKPESTELKVEFPAVRVSFKSGDEEDETNENEEDNECEKLLKSLENRNKSVRLPLNEINTLKVNPREARSIRSYFFNPKSHSFTPMNTDEKFIKKYSSQK